MPERGTLFGFDFGLKRIGIAVGQFISCTSSALTIIAAQNGEPDWPALMALIAEWRPKALVVGVPYNMDGSEFDMTLRARAFAQQLQIHTQLPVHEVDERLTTIEAENQFIASQGTRKFRHKTRLKRPRMDAIAAQLILESWMRAHHAIEP